MSNNQINTFPYFSIFTHIQVHAYHLLKVTPISHINSKSKQNAGEATSAKKRPKAIFQFRPKGRKRRKAAEGLKQPSGAAAAVLLVDV